MAEFYEDNVPYTKLLLDPNNYRFHNSEDFRWVKESNFHRDSVQRRAFNRLGRRKGLTQLKNSILKNGLLPIERLIVRPYLHNKLFVVVEGNRRLAALRWIAEDQEAGVPISDSLLVSLDNVPVLVIEDCEEDPIFREAILGVRHVSGIKEWGGYQRARLIFELRDTHKLPSSEIAERLGMSTTEVNRRYRAFKALAQMRNHEEFGEYARSDMYPLFHEAVAIPSVKEWLGWDETNAQFTDEDQLEHFYGLITPNDPENAISRDPKVPTRTQVRELRSIVANPEAKRVLLDPSRSFIAAVSIATSSERASSWSSQVAETNNALESMGVFDLLDLVPDDIAALEKLKELAEHLLALYEKIKS